jgi:hypothetical protein
MNLTKLHFAYMSAIGYANTLAQLLKDISIEVPDNIKSILSREPVLGTTASASAPPVFSRRYCSDSMSNWEHIVDETRKETREYFMLFLSLLYPLPIWSSF